MSKWKEPLLQEMYFQNDQSWIIEEDVSRTDKRKLHEALFTISNGYFGMRGINEDMPSNTFPGTYIAGAFDKSECMCSEWVNFPNAVPLYIEIDGKKVSLDTAKVIKHKRFLDLKYGSICRETIFKVSEKEICYKSIRYICRHDRNLAIIKAEITPLNWSGELKIITELDGTAHNAFANYFPDEWARHLCLLSINDNYDMDTVMVVRTRDVDVKYCFATYLFIDRPFEEIKRFKKIYGERVVEEATVQVEEGATLAFSKYIAVEDTRHVTEDELVKVTTNILNRNKTTDIDFIWEQNKKAWEEKWKLADICVKTEDNQEMLNAKIRFNIYQLLMNGSDSDYRHGIGIKGFTGEMYRGHYFWDTEMYMFPFFVYTNPWEARNLLVFRHRILDSAKKNAASRGFRGALYCWEDDERGNEGINNEIIRETGELRTRETIDQYHKNLAIMYAIFSYYRATNDVEFMVNYGADMLVENMRFWESYLIWNENDQCYDSIKVMGPDEYHANINNNYYTNYLFKAISKMTLDFIEQCQKVYKNSYYKICKRLAITDSEKKTWKILSEKINLPRIQEGVLEQYEGYFDLEDYTFTKRNEFGIPVIVELDELKNPSNPKYTPDLIAYHEELVRMSQRMRIIKQADTVLLFNILPFDFTEEIEKNTLLFYEERTLHYSSLSPGVYALCAARVSEMEIAEKYFDLSLDMDLKDVKHESENALHTPTSGEIYTIITQGYAGVFPDGDTLVVKPNIPKKWSAIEFCYTWRGNRLSFQLTKDKVVISSKGQRETKIRIGGKTRQLYPKDTLEIELNL
ncbi:MAG: glycosyl hydrolase family 65 protein [Velocimicrobium sp.]